MRVLEQLLKAIRDAAVFNPEVQVAPACILWPDRDRQWEAVIDRLQTELPDELFVLGEYSPAGRTGPAIWLRCVLANAVDDIPFSSEESSLPAGVAVCSFDLGGKATVAKMFVNNSTGQRGLVCQYDVVCFDEVSGISFDQKDFTVIRFREETHLKSTVLCIQGQKTKKGLTAIKP